MGQYESMKAFTMPKLFRVVEVGPISRSSMLVGFESAAVCSSVASSVASHASVSREFF